jgi:hypothetical protein
LLAAGVVVVTRCVSWFCAVAAACGSIADVQFDTARCHRADTAFAKAAIYKYASVPFSNS